MPKTSDPLEGGPRDAMLKAAVRLFRARGYEGVGVAELLAESGAPRGSLYFHFPGGKEQIGVEALAYAGRADVMGVRALAAEDTTLEEMIARLFARLGESLERYSYRYGCGIGLIALEMSDTSEPLRAAAAAAFDDWRQALVAAFLARGASATVAEQLTQATLVGVQGAIVLARARRDLAPLRDAAAAVVALARSLIPSGN